MFADDRAQVRVVPTKPKLPSTRGSAVWLGVAIGLGTMNDQPIIIGEQDHRGHPLPFGLSAADARQHLYLIATPRAEVEERLNRWMSQERPGVED